MAKEDWIEAGNSTSETWDKESPIEGTYKHKKENVGVHGSNVYVIERESDGEKVSVWGSTVIDGRFDEIPAGSKVKIEYKGEVKGKNSTYKDYKIMYKPVPSAIADEMEGAEVA